MRAARGADAQCGRRHDVGAGDSSLVDGDALPDAWEDKFGLDPARFGGDNGPAGDPDRDGRTNLEELRDGTHPRGFATRYLAEGASSGFFRTTVALMNPDPVQPARVLLLFQSRRGAASEFVLVPPRTRRTVTANALPALQNAEFSTRVESDVPVVVDRTMSWDGRGYGAHSESSVPAPQSRWYLAEGATIGGFQLFYLVQAVDPDVAIDVTYLFADGNAVQRCYGSSECKYGTLNDQTTPFNGRFNIWVNQDPALNNRQLAAIVTARHGKRIIVERAMYMNTDSGRLFWGAGHESAGIPQPSTRWFFAEGATGPFFDLFILIGNPNPTPATVTARYLLPDGTVCEKTYGQGVRDRRIPPLRRFNIWVDWEIDGVEGAPAGCAPDRLANTAVSVTVTSDIPVVAERAMWWPGDFPTWTEAHSSAGATGAGTLWAIAEGEVDPIGSSRGMDTYILVANTSAHTGCARVTLLFEDGRSAERYVRLAAESRTNVPVGAPPALDPAGFGDVAPGRRFGALVESLAAPWPAACGAPPAILPGAAQIVVERAIYWNSGGRFWDAGTNALATKLR